MSQSFTRGVPIDTDPTLAADSNLLVPSQYAVKTYVDNGLSNKQNTLGYTPVDKAGDTMIGNLILNADPIAGLQAATKQYVDNLVNGVDWKEAAHTGTVAALPTYNVTGSGQILTGTANGAIPSATTDNHAIGLGERLLVKNEIGLGLPNNGIYVVTQVGSISQPYILTRSSDANTPAYLLEATISVINGSTLSNSIWHLTPAAVPIVIGTTNLTWVQLTTGGITTLNTLTTVTQLFATGNTGTDFNISSSIDTHTFNIPTASGTNRGLLSTTDWTTFNSKQDALGFTAENVANKSTNLTSPDNTKYPTTLAVSTQFNDTRSILGSKRTGGIWYTQTLGGTVPSTSAFANTSVFLTLDVFEVDTTINAVAVEIVTTAGAAGSVLRLGLYKIASEDFSSATLVSESSTIAADTTGFRQWTPGSPLNLTPGRYFWALSHNSASNITFRNLPSAGCRPLGGSANIAIAYNISAVGARVAFGAMPSNITGFTSVTYATAAPQLMNYRIA